MNRQQLLKKLRQKNTKKKHWLKYPDYKDYLDSQEWIEVKKIFKKGSPRLEIIFDAFDEICNRLRTK